RRHPRPALVLLVLFRLRRAKFRPRGGAADLPRRGPADQSAADRSRVAGRRGRGLPPGAAAPARSRAAALLPPALPEARAAAPGARTRERRGGGGGPEVPRRGPGVRVEPGGV